MQNNNSNKNLNNKQKMPIYPPYQRPVYPYYPPRVPYYPTPVPPINKVQNVSEEINKPKENKVKKQQEEIKANNNNAALTQVDLNPYNHQLYMEPKIKTYNRELATMEESKKFSIISLILGIISLALLFLDLPCGIIGLIFAIKARKTEKNIFSTIGMITSIIGIAKAIILLILFNLFIKIFAGIFLFLI